MEYLHRGDLQAEQLEISIHDMRRQTWHPFGPGRIKGIVEDVVDALQCLPIPIHGKGVIATEAIDSHVIQSMEVVGVGMRVEYSIYIAHVITQCLQTQIR